MIIQMNYNKLTLLHYCLYGLDVSIVLLFNSIFENLNLTSIVSLMVI